ncbi:DUF2238 domain-containing protein [Tahibacter amnicola]|uniref:DUF2238 domain-containing protein n=1 Tax=Tahibacter amnicola TaxID=2976241 RepID=A0ABY6B9K3_9GAMM|nr:DUF2238 domain-containing protein [Tahibacter amnicola]UXI66467.1 DUF2238 domain-containing protein [Tahibacter amnicola]
MRQRRPPTSPPSAVRPAASGARYPLWLLGAFLAYWIILAIKPWYRSDWILENVLVAISVPLLVATYRRHRFSNASYSLLFLFLVLHETGAHYTYEKVPYDAWFQALSGHTLSGLLDLERNHFDRLAHFLFGLLLTPVMGELVDQRSPQQGAWRFLVPVAMIGFLSAVFELIEWGAAILFGGDLGQAYLGTQGDVWDAHKDMALAIGGAVIAQLGSSWMRLAQVSAPKAR